MKLPEYANFDEKDQFFNSQLINSKSEFDLFYADKVGTKNTIFRGVHEAKYKIFTSSQREWYTNNYNLQGIKYTDYIQSIIDNIKSNNILKSYYKSLNIAQNDLLWLSLLQHFSAPTPLLDFTHKLDIALFFALDNLQKNNSDKIIEDYFSIYYINRTECGVELVNIIDMLKIGLENGEKMLNEYRKMNPDINIDDSLLTDVDKYTKWKKTDGTKDGLHKIQCGFIDNPLAYSYFLQMYKTKETLYWSNLNLIAQQGCFIMYTKDTEPLEEHFSNDTTYLPKIHCVNVHKPLEKYVKEKYIQKITESIIYPKTKVMCKNAYIDFQKKLS